MPGAESWKMMLVPSCMPACMYKNYREYNFLLTFRKTPNEWKKKMKLIGENKAMLSKVTVDIDKLLISKKSSRIRSTCSNFISTANLILGAWPKEKSLEIREIGAKFNIFQILLIMIISGH